MANDKKQRRGKRGQKKKKSDAVEERPGNDETKAEELAEQEEEGVNEESPALVPAPASSVQPFYGLVPTDIRQYAMNVEKMLEEQVFEDSEDQTNFIGNIFRGFEDNELRLATDYDGSRILEKLLKLSDEFQLRVFMDRLTGRFADLFRHQYASHVCQTLLSVAADAVDKEIRSSTTEGPEPVAGEHGVLLPMQNLILDMCDEIRAQIQLLAADRYASHIVRLILGLLVGAPPSEQSAVVRSKRSKSFAQKLHQPPSAQTAQRPRLVPVSFRRAAGGLVSAIFDGLGQEEMSRFAFDPVTSPVLQQVLAVVGKIASDGQETVQELTNLPQRILGLDHESEGRSPFVEKLLRDPVGSHLLQKIIQQLDGPSFHRLYLAYFRNRLEELSAHPLANFVVQELAAGAKTKIELEMMIDELGPHWPKLLFGTRAGVVVKLLEACLRLKAGFQEAAKWLQQAFDYGTPDAKKQAVAYLLAMRPRDASQEPPDLLVSNYSIHGALLLQTVVNFPADSNRIVIQSFMDLTSPVLRHLSLHPVGCRVVEAYIVSQQVGLKAKKRLLKSLAGNYADLAMDKYGSHIVDKLWSQVADMDDKEQIAEELLKSLSALQNSHHGKFVVRNCRLENYKREREQWRKKEAGADRRKEMFKEFLEPEGTNREEQAVAIDPLLQSKAFDETMKSLGFSEKHEPSAHAKGADKSKKQRNSQKHGKDKKAKRTADKSAEALDLDLPDVSLPAKAPETGRANATTAKDTGLELVLDAVRSSGKKRKGSGGDKGGRNDKKRKFMS